MLIASLVLSLASILAPEDGPPVYGPCSPKNPAYHYTRIPEGYYDQHCWLVYKATYTGQVAIYWERIAQCGGGSCECYAEAWAKFIAEMDQAEADAWACDYNAG